MPDRIDWMSGKPIDAIIHYSQWRQCVELADKGDLSPLISMLVSDTPIGPDARDLIGDLLSRYHLVKKKGGQKIPRYRQTSKEGKMRLMVRLVTHYRENGIELDNAIQAALRDDRRESLQLAGDDRYFADEELDDMISDDDISQLKNRIKRNRKPK